MKILHILHTETPKPSRTLKFIQAINEQTGSSNRPGFQPEEWKNVRHITGKLYYAWDDNPEGGTVYLGEYESSK